MHLSHGGTRAAPRGAACDVAAAAAALLAPPAAGESPAVIKLGLRGCFVRTRSSPPLRGSERRGAKRQLLAPAAAARRRRHCGVQDGGGRGARAAAPPRRRSRAGAAGRGGGGTRAAGSTSPRRGARARPTQGPADGRPPRAGPPHRFYPHNPELPPHPRTSALGTSILTHPKINILLT